MFAYCNITSARSSTDSPRSGPLTRYRMCRQWDTWHLLTSCRDAGRVTLADQLPTVPAVGHMTLADQLPTVPAVGHMTLADRLPTVPAVGHMTLADQLPTVPAVGHMTLADRFSPRDTWCLLTIYRLSQQWVIRHCLTSCQFLMRWGCRPNDIFVTV